MRRGDWTLWPGEAQRREERRSEVRLAEGLQRLDQARNYHLNTLTREQRRLHRDLNTTGNPWRRGLHSLRPSNHNPARPAGTLLPRIPLAGRETDRRRATKPQTLSSLQARVQEFINSGENRTEHPETLCLPDLKRQPVSNLTTNTEENTEREKGEQREMQKDREKEAGESERDREKEKEWMLREREGDKERGAEMNGNRCPSSPALFPSQVLPPDLRTVHTLPSFTQSLAEARKARYIRHRGQPLCERELSIREIFSQDSRDTPSL